VADVNDCRIGGIDKWVQGHRPLGNHQSLGELRAADQAEMQREREPESTDRQQAECRAGEDFNRPVPAEPPYLVT
jgi:hypothetical protein